MAISEEERKERFKEAPKGTYSFLETHDGFETGIFGTQEDGTLYAEPFLCINKEVTCDETGGSCMAFRLVRWEGEGLLDVMGHITDRDEIVRLFMQIDTKVDGKTLYGYPHIQPSIESAMTEVKSLLPKVDLQKNQP